MLSILLLSKAGGGFCWWYLTDIRIKSRFFGYFTSQALNFRYFAKYFSNSISFKKITQTPWSIMGFQARLSHEDHPSKHISTIADFHSAINSGQLGFTAITQYWEMNTENFSRKFREHMTRHCPKKPGSGSRNSVLPSPWIRNMKIYVLLQCVLTLRTAQNS